MRHPPHKLHLHLAGEVNNTQCTGKCLLPCDCPNGDKCFVCWFRAYKDLRETGNPKTLNPGAIAQEAGLVIKQEPHTQRVPRSQRGGEIVEPLVGNLGTVF